MTITARQFEVLTLVPGTLIVAKDGIHKMIVSDNYFVMTGENHKRHTLYVAATDLNRLNAHWSVFISR